MITLEQVQEYVKNLYTSEQDSRDRIIDQGFAYIISTQPREYLESNDKSKMSYGGGPMVIIKETGDVYRFSSSPIHMFGKSGIGVSTALTEADFNTALSELKEVNESLAKPIDKIG